jgi:hypothetical protein
MTANTDVNETNDFACIAELLGAGAHYRKQSRAAVNPA